MKNFVCLIVILMLGGLSVPLVSTSMYEVCVAGAEAKRERCIKKAEKEYEKCKDDDETWDTVCYLSYISEVIGCHAQAAGEIQSCSLRVNS